MSKLKDQVKKKKTKAQRSKRNFSILLALPLVACVLVSAGVMINQQIDINRLSKEKAVIEQQVNGQKKKNDEMSAIINSGNIDEYVEREAREKYGYVRPDEKVYFDIS